MMSRTLWAAISITLLLCACSSNQPQWLKELAPQEASSSAAPLIDTALFFDENTIEYPQLSSDGRQVAFIKTIDDIPNIFIQDITAEGSSPIQLTFSEAPIAEFEWSVDGKAIYYLQDNNGDENYSLFTISLHDQKTLNLTNAPKARALLIGKIDDDPNHIMIGLNDRDAQLFDLYRVNTQTGERVRTFKNTTGFIMFVTDKQGNLVAGQRPTASGGQVIFGFNDRHPEGRELFQTTQNESLSLMSLNKQGNGLYFTSNSGEVDKIQLRLLDLESTKVQVIDEDPLGKSDFFKSLFAPSGELLLTSYYDGYRQDYVKSENFSSTFNALKAQLTAYELDIIDITSDEKTLLVKAGNGKTPNGFYVYNAANNALDLIYQNNPTLKPQHLADRLSISYAARDGELIQAYLTLPQGQNRKNMPLVVIPHGGPWARDYANFDDGYFNRMAQLIANRGYLVLQPNFRSSTGFGKRFFNLGHRSWGKGAMQHDITDGVDYLTHLGIADRERVAIFGGSYGGYAALAGATFTPETYAAVISFVGPSSLITLVDSFPEYWRPLLKGTWFHWVGDPKDPKDVIDMQARSPLNYVDNIQAPILLVQGANDPRVKQQESEQIAKLMHKKGLPVEYLLAKDEGHGFKKQANRIALAIAVETFLAEHLGGKSKAVKNPAMEKHLQSLMQDVSTI